MTIYLSKKKAYNKNDSYDKKMNYTNVVFGANETTLSEMLNNTYLTTNYVIWYRN